MRFAFLVSALLAAACGPGAEPAAGPASLPLAVTNNAVAVHDSAGHAIGYSFLGLDSTKLWSGITRRAFRGDLASGVWMELPEVPGAEGRLAATAQVVRGRVYLFGGYTVDSTGRERSVPEVDVYDPATNAWSAAAPMPVPVDDVVSGVWRDSLIYIVSGWHDTDNVRDVQIYDPAADRWTAATPIPGPGVFGHTGGVLGDAIVFVDGVARRPSGELPPFGMVPQAWLGRIDPARPERIAWSRLPDHPGPATYRAAAAPCGDRLVFFGGTDNPYNYDGIGYDGTPSRPGAFRFAWSGSGEAWVDSLTGPVATMDHRGLLITGDGAWVVGGMRAGRRVSAEVTAVPRPDC